MFVYLLELNGGYNGIEWHGQHYQISIDLEMSMCLFSCLNWMDRGMDSTINRPGEVAGHDLLWNLARLHWTELSKSEVCSYSVTDIVYFSIINCISNKIMLQSFSSLINFTRSNWAELSAWWLLMMMIVPGPSVSLSQTELHDSRLEFSMAMKCFTDDSNDEVVIF